MGSPQVTGGIHAPRHMMDKKMRPSRPDEAVQTPIQLDVRSPRAPPESQVPGHPQRKEQARDAQRLVGTEVFDVVLEVGGSGLRASRYGHARNPMIPASCPNFRGE